MKLNQTNTTITVRNKIGVVLLKEDTYQVDVSVFRGGKLYYTCTLPQNHWFGEGRRKKCKRIARSLAKHWLNPDLELLVLCPLRTGRGRTSFTKRSLNNGYYYLY